MLMLLADGLVASIPACVNGTADSVPRASGSGVANLPTDGTGTGGAPSPNASTTSCPLGSEQCDCYGNGTCNPGLTCASQLCVNLAGLLGAAGGSTTNDSGGATNAGGSSAEASGGYTVTGGASTTGGTSNRGGNGTTGGSAATGGGLAMGGSPATGGALATGGHPTAGGTAATGGNSFWTTVAYSATGAPNPADGHHNPGQNCIQCHASGSTSGAPVWMFGGTIYQSNGTTPAPNVQVGINDGNTLHTTYTATNGNFWLASSGTINWAQAQVRIRDANGELTMAGATPAATCNLCHSSTTYPRITAP